MDRPPWSPDARLSAVEIEAIAEAVARRLQGQPTVRLLDAAGLATDGASVGMADIAQRAGVGVGTLYRSFGGRSQLVEAVYRDALRVLTAEATRLSAGADPWEALVAWTGIYVREYEAKVGMLSQLRPIFEAQPELLRQSRQEAIDALDLVLQAAQAAGAARSDVTADDLYHLVNSLLSPELIVTGRSPVLLAVVLDGLRRSEGVPPPTA